jgi:N-hydroxyarylamine O-acetyltransferase
LDLANYLQRIHYSGPVRPDLDCLRAIHRQHVRSIPYEDLDVQLGRPLDLNTERIRRKLIDEGRGGWCYEMNGLLGWALQQIGFDVTRMTGGVMRSEAGDAAYGNHLVLRVDLNGKSWIADAGLGDALQEPIPLREGAHQQNGRHYTLTQLDAETWRLENHPGRLPPTMDFLNKPADEGLFEATCANLQSDPESMFVQNLMCFRCRADGGVDMLLGRVHADLASGTPQKRLIADLEDFERVLQQVFGLQEPEIDTLWQKVVARHQALFGDKPADAIELMPM